MDRHGAKVINITFSYVVFDFFIIFEFKHETIFFLFLLYQEFMEILFLFNV